MNTGTNPNSNPTMHIDAQQHIDNLVDNFRNKLTEQSKTLANDDKVVLKSHVDRAYRIINNKVKESWLPEFSKFVGATSFGGGVSLFICEISATNIHTNTLIIAFFLVVIGLIFQFLGMILDSREI